MGYVIYNITTTAIRKGKAYKTMAAAKAAMTREQLDQTKWRIAEEVMFAEFVSKKVVRVNMMTGQEYEEDVNTPLCCSSASETYWSS
jgi:uncharacterized protein (AIM24 family)